MPSSKLSSLTIDEDTGSVVLKLRDYNPEEFLTFESLLLLALANKISTDADWTEDLVSEAEANAMSQTTIH